MTHSQRLALTLLFACCAVGCAPAKQDVVVFVSGDTAGWITPCGCTSNQSGGLSRRDTLVSAARDQHPVIVLDVGGAVTGKSTYDWLKLQSIVTGQMQMQIDAFNLGGPEAQFDAKSLRDLQEETGVPFVSANIRDLQGNAVAVPSRTIHRGGQTIAVIGIVDPELVGESLIAEDPYRSVYEQIQSVDADYTIVLAYMNEASLRDLAKKLPDVDAIIGGPTGQVLPPRMVGNVLVGSSTNKGKFLLRLSLAADANATPIETEIVEVSSDVSMAQRQQDNLQDFYRRLGEADVSPTETQFVSTRLLGGDRLRIAGSTSCQSCHTVDDSVWHDSKHAHAWQSLQTTGAQVDPACQRCHTTGYGMAGGFETAARSLPLVNVGCENCHGPSQAHVADPRTKTPFAAKQQCVACHDHENSPQFDYHVYWARVVHGKPVANQPPQQESL